MKSTALVARNSFWENARSRFFAVCIVFGVVLVYTGMLLGILAQEQQARILLDFGLSLIELAGLAVAVYGAATGLLGEIESKTVYLALTRPVARAHYLLGRFAGLMASVLSAMCLMAAFHVALLLCKGWAWNGAYLWALLGSFLAIFITTSAALFLSLFFSSSLTALLIAGILWTLGHFIPEIRFLADRAPGSAIWFLKAVSYVIPNLGLLNWRDNLASAAIPPLALWGSYCLLYAGIWLACAARLFSRREL
ncbi:MAG: ABC transporter permease subunit [Elusimicrobia bacterium]|nr:ABC transporter permease subunit [Elusimicrobiota bacterium]